MKLLKILVISACAMVSSTLVALAQPKSCSAFKSGEFYYYPRNTLDQYHIFVSGDVEKVVSMKKKKGARYYDSSLYKIEWKDDCSYILKYTDGSGLTEDELKFVTKHKLAYHIDSIATDYYVFSSYQDKVSGSLLGKDTMWMRPQEHSEDNMLFGVTDPATIRKHHFSDTSKVALLYIYRPGKLKLSMSDLYLFYNDLPLAVLKNKSAAVFALFKEGPFTLRSLVNGTKVEGDLPMEVKYGKIYYVRAEMIWGLYKTGNTHLQFTTMDPKEGKQEFEEIYQQ